MIARVSVTAMTLATPIINLWRSRSVDNSGVSFGIIPGQTVSVGAVVWDIKKFSVRHSPSPPAWQVVTMSLTILSCNVYTQKIDGKHWEPLQWPTSNVRIAWIIIIYCSGVIRSHFIILQSDISRWWAKRWNLFAITKSDVVSCCQQLSKKL